MKINVINRVAAACLAGLIVLLLSLIVQNTAQSKDQPAKPNMHNYTDLDRFCMDFREGDSSSLAIGYKQVLPWASTVLCLEADGIKEITQTMNGSDTQSHHVSATSSATDFVWVKNVSTRISMADGLNQSCPNGEQPLAIIPLHSEKASMGAHIHRGAPICAREGYIVLYQKFEKGRLSQVHRRWDGFTPYRR